MIRRRAAALSALLLAACTVASDGSDRLTAKSNAWTLAGRDLDVRVHAGSALAGRDLRLTMAVGESLVEGDWRLSRGDATMRIPAASLAPGVNRILVKCGSERTTLAVRVVPLAWVAAGAALPIAVLLLLGSLARRARRRRDGAATG